MIKINSDNSMITNQIMTRDESFVQRTKDGYFNATSLLTKWNGDRGQNKQLAKYKTNQATKEYIEQLEKEGVEKPMKSGRGSGKSSGTWMHPKLFIDFAMWVSVEFKSKVIDYVLDGLIKSRNDAGDYYNEMSAAILESHVEFYKTKPKATIYIVEAKRINWMLGLDKKERNEMSESELNAITQLQKANALLIRKRVGKQARIKQLMFQAEILNQ